MQIGKADRLAKSIAGRTGPIILTDVSGHLGDPLDIYLQHIGTNPDTGWYSFRAQPPQYVGRNRSCTWEWRAAQRSFWAKCDHAVTTSMPPAPGLVQYPVQVVNQGNVRIDLGASTTPTTTTRPATTTTVIVTGHQQADRPARPVATPIGHSADTVSEAESPRAGGRSSAPSQATLRRFPGRRGSMGQVARRGASWPKERPHVRHPDPCAQEQPTTGPQAFRPPQAA